MFVAGDVAPGIVGKHSVVWFFMEKCFQNVEFRFSDNLICRVETLDVPHRLKY